MRTFHNNDALRAMTQPELLTNRIQFESLSLNEQAHIMIALVDAMNNANSLDVLIWSDCVHCMQSDGVTSWELWQALGAFEVYEQLRLQLQLIVWFSFVASVTQSTKGETLSN